MATNTYVALASYTVSGSSISSYTFNSIPTSYTDLMLVVNYQPTAGSVCFMQVGNGTVDTGSNYSQTGMGGYGGTHSYRYSNQTTTNIGPEAVSTPTTTWSSMIIQFQNYSNTTTNKTFLSRYTDGYGGETNAKVNLWRSTAAINTLKIYPSTGNFNVGSTFTLYGVAAEGQGYATGGIVTSDANYYYHAFTSSGTFTPSRSLSADILVVAGGGGGGGGGSTYAGEGGGGAGGLLAFTSQSLTSGTAYTCTVGAGGNGGVGYGTNGTSGSNSTFGALTATVGGGGAGSYNGGGPSSGGSGAGGNGYTTNGAWNTGASGTTGQGNAGGNGNTNYGGGGGGGAGAVGGTANSTRAGDGGAGVDTYSSWLSATNLGVSGYIAGGGGGGGATNINPSNVGGLAGAGGGGTGGTANANGTSAVANTGGGGGGPGGGGSGGATAGGAGGSGLIIVRYAK